MTVSPTFWNQDDGTEWGRLDPSDPSSSESEQARIGQAALQLYTIEVKVASVIVGDALPDDTLIFTVIGANPTEGQTDDGSSDFA